jgi:hypothetical protein
MIQTKKTVTACGVIFGCLTLSSAAFAQEGFEIGARLGYGIPMGEVSEDSDLSDGISGQIPLTLDVGYRVIEPLFIGAYLGYGIGFVGDELDDVCTGDVDCSVSTFDLGLQAQYHLDPGSGMDFWFGAGLGYESMTSSTEAAGTTIDATAKALPQIMLQLGLDFGEPGMGYGPFLRFTHATFDEFEGECDGDACGAITTVDGDIDDDVQAGHQWLTIGFRGTFVL